MVRPFMRASVLSACTFSALPLVLAAQSTGTMIGTAYDSLLHAPLAGADVHVRGTLLRAVTDSAGRFRFDAVPAGAQTLVLTHPGLDSAGLYGLIAPTTVQPDRPALVTIASPSLATVWRLLCGRPTPFGTSDTALAYGTVSDAATGSRYAGAGVASSWRALRVVGPADVSVRPLGDAVRTDSLGNYYACGLTADVTVRLRAYAGGDSSGAVEIAPGGRPVVRRDFTVGRGAVRGAALRGAVVRADGVTPVPDAQVIVEEGRQTFADANGTFLLASLPAGTRWLQVRAVAHTPVGQAVDLRDGDTVQVRVALAVAPIVLDTVRVQATRMSAEMAGFEERRRTGFGFTLTEAQIKYRTNIRAVFVGVPHLRVVGPAVGQFSLVFQLPSGATCVPTFFIDGRQGAQHELYAFAPDQIAGVEFYARPSTVPTRFQTSMNECGAIVVWTKTLQ